VISVYNAEGHFVKNERDAYSVNSVTAERALDGSVTVAFGGCDDDDADCLPIFPTGTTWSASTDHGPRSSTATGRSPRCSPRNDGSGEPSRSLARDLLGLGLVGQGVDVALLEHPLGDEDRVQHAWEPRVGMQ
jgi:hypothetical protein